MKKEIIEERKLTLVDVKALYSLIGSETILKLLDINERSREILEMKWKHCMLTKDIALHFGISIERTLQLYQMAVRRLKSKVLFAVKKYEQMKLVFDKMEDIKYENKELQKENELFRQRFNALSPQEKLICGNIDVLKMRLVDLDLSIRNLNVLRNEEIYTINDLIQYSREDLNTFGGIGKKCLDEIEEVLKKFGVKLNDKNQFSFSHFYKW